MKASTNNRKFETLILAIGILMAVLAGIHSVWLSESPEDTSSQLQAEMENVTEPVEAESKLLETSCQYLKIFTVKLVESFI